MACLMFLVIGTPFFIICLPFVLISDARRLVGVIVRSLVASGKMVCHHLMGAFTQTHSLDLRCVSWMLRTSLDKVIHLSALKYLESLMTVPTNFNPTLVEYCFNTFVGCVDAGSGEVVVTRGLEQLATVSTQCFFHTVPHPPVMDPASSVLKDIHRRYTKVFPTNIDFRDHQFSHNMNAIHRVFIQFAVDRKNFKWSAYTPPSDEHTIVADTLVKLAQFEYKRPQQMKVPRLTLRFALRSLSLDPPPPTPVVVDCLSIIAVDLGCDVQKDPGK